MYARTATSTGPRSHPCCCSITERLERAVCADCASSHPRNERQPVHGMAFKDCTSPPATRSGHGDGVPIDPTAHSWSTLLIPANPRRRGRQRHAFFAGGAATTGRTGPIAGAPFHHTVIAQVSATDLLACEPEWPYRTES